MPKEEVPASRKLGRDDALSLARAARTIIVAKGKKSEKLSSSKAKIANLKGPTGNYRAPMLRKGKTLLVGFHADTLDSLI